MRRFAKAVVVSTLAWFAAGCQHTNARTPSAAPEPVVSVPRDSSKFFVVARRDDAFILNAMDDGSMLVNVGTEFAVAKPDGEWIRDAAWSRGFEFDSDLLHFNRETKIWGSRWPEGVILDVASRGTGRITGKRHRMYRYEANGWARIPNDVVDGVLRWHYASTKPWLNGTQLALRMFSSALEGLGHGSRTDAKLARALEAVTPRFDVIGGRSPAPQNVPEFAKGDAPYAFVTWPDGAACAIVERTEGKESHPWSRCWGAGETTGELARLPDIDSSCPSAEKLELRAAPGRRAWAFAFGRENYIARFDGRAWSKVEPPSNDRPGSLRVEPSGEAIVATMFGDDSDGNKGVREWRKVGDAAWVKIAERTEKRSEKADDPRCYNEKVGDLCRYKDPPDDVAASAEGIDWGISGEEGLNYPPSFEQGTQRLLWRRSGGGAWQQVELPKVRFENDAHDRWGYDKQLGYVWRPGMADAMTKEWSLSPWRVIARSADDVWIAARVDEYKGFSSVDVAPPGHWVLLRSKPMGPVMWFKDDVTLHMEEHERQPLAAPNSDDCEGHFFVLDEVETRALTPQRRGALRAILKGDAVWKGEFGVPTVFEVESAGKTQIGAWTRRFDGDVAEALKKFGDAVERKISGRKPVLQCRTPVPTRRFVVEE